MGRHKRIPAQDIKHTDQLLHSRAHGIAAIKSSLEALCTVLQKPFDSVSADNWTLAQGYARGIEHEVACLLADTLNHLDALAPGGYMDLQRAEVRVTSPATILEEMIPPYQERAARREIDVRFTDESAGTPKVELEVNMVRRAFHNALTNAVKYSFRGGHERYRFVAVRCRRRLPVSGGFLVEFENYGVGISQDDLRKIWEPGYRATAAIADHTLGSGLGLPQIRQTMRQHGGQATLTSVPVEGAAYKTTLTMQFPEETNIRRYF